MNASLLTTLADLHAARERVGPVIHLTPVQPSDSLSRLAGRSVVLKSEYEQRTGSFKIRGAYNRIAQLPPGCDVVAASAGNHAQGVALAATLTGRRSTIFMPQGAAIPKTDATRNYGAEVRLEGEAVDDAMVAAKEFAREKGAVWVPPFDDPDIIAGQGTLGLEVLDQVPDAGVVVVPVGGGGLIGGVAAAIKLTRPDVRVVGVEAVGAPTLTRALEAGHPVRLEQLSTMADGIALRSVSERTLAHANAFVDDVVLVDEEEMTRAILLLTERAKAVVEPAGAASLAAVLSGRVGGSGTAVPVLSGGNVDPLLLTKLIEHGLSVAGRYLVLRIVIADHPGALAALTALLARMGLNVLDVEHHRSGRSLGLAEVEVMVTVETRNFDHHREVLAALAGAGYRASPVADS
ncbi:MAG: threonine ammonia-lyase [Acidimicrobiaceae bacterium]|nr:threonine ammonia-lyase [Acidimicrobiaceae bacterium]